MLEPAAHCGNDTTHKTLEIMCNVHAWHQQRCKSCANGSSIVVLHFSDHRTKEMLGLVDSKVGPVSNFAQQLPTTCNKMCNQTEHVTFNNVGSCWPTLGSLSSDIFERRTSTGNRLFAHLSRASEQIFGQIVPLRIKTLGNTNTVA